MKTATRSFVQLAILLLLALLQVGCVRVMKVYEEDTDGLENKIGGIPFYAKKQICHQTTTYAQTWLEIGLSMETQYLQEKNGSVSVLATQKQPKQSKRVDGSSIAQVQQLQDLVLQANVCESDLRCDLRRDLAAGASGGDVRCLQQYLISQGRDTGGADGIFGPKTESAVRNWQKEKGLLASGQFDAATRRAFLDEDDCPSALDALLAFSSLPALSTLSQPGSPIGNFIEPKVVVDYTREMRLNGNLPWFGTSTLTTELNSDGTLSKSTATADTKLAESITSLIPLKEYLTGKFVKAGDPADATAAVRSMAEDGLKSAAPIKPKDIWSVTSIQLTVEEKGYLYAFEAQHADPDNLCAEFASSSQSLAPIPFDLTSGVYKRSALGEQKHKKPEKPENSIGFSGEVTLPKSSGSE